MTKCAACRADNPSDTLFCAKCGTEFDSIPQVSVPRTIMASVFTLAFLWLGSALEAQQKRPRIVSPEFNPDRTVTLRVYAPRAGQVNLNIQFLEGPQSMKRDEEGVWSIQVGPAEPNVYYYSFDIDGFQSLDPLNPSVKVALQNTTSLLVYPGDQPMFYDERDVPHGVLHYHRYASQSVKMNRGVFVYTPPGYDPTRSVRYPVLYLLHGSGDTEQSWTAVGRAPFILDNLLAERKAVRMIIVMPFGHVPPPLDQKAEEIRTRAFVDFERDLLNDVIPLVEKNYRVEKNAAGRAIAGLSMGGGQAVRVGLGHLELFGWIGAFSSSVDQETMEKTMPVPEEINKRLRLFWIGCGRSDFLFDRNQKFLEFLIQKKIKYQAHITEGVHTWTVWRDYLHELIPLLFRK